MSLSELKYESLGDCVDCIDVSKFSELPQAPIGMRFIDFLSEPKGLRCFLVPKGSSRGDFMDKQEHLLDQRLVPIYKNDSICVRQDSSFPIPGFYIVSPVQHFRFMDEMPEILSIRMFYIIRTLRKAMREVLGIPFIYMFYEEKLSRHGDVHYWLLPIYNISESNILLRFDLESYLNSFDFHKEKDTILKLNDKLREYLLDIKLKEKDDALKKNLEIDFGA
jgi:diadenosine tetraphosphate (Ap4A) HIT family hydrolase